MKLTNEQLEAIKRRMAAVEEEYRTEDFTITERDCSSLLYHIIEIEKERDEARAATPEIFLKSFDSETATMELKAEAFRVLAEMAYHYGEALGMKNYIESKAEIRGRCGDECFTVTLQRQFGKTPHEMRLAAEQQRDKLLAALRPFADCVDGHAVIPRRVNWVHFQDAHDAVKEVYG